MLPMWDRPELSYTEREFETPASADSLETGFGDWECRWKNRSTRRGRCGSTS